MGRIDVALERLQIVALQEGLLQVAVLLRRGEELVARQQRRLALAHIGEHHAGALDDRIGGVPDLVLVAALRRLRRLLQTAAGDVEKPAMIEAAQPAILDPAVAEIGAAMRAVEAEQAGAAAIVAEQHQLLAEDLDRLGGPPGGSSSASAIGCQ